jgi:hypothetical protein
MEDLSFFVKVIDLALQRHADTRKSYFEGGYGLYQDSFYLKLQHIRKEIAP